MEKKNIYNEKKKEKKKIGAEILKGYCPVCVVTERLGSRRAQGRWGAGERAGARTGRAWGAQMVDGRWALGERARCRRTGRAGHAVGAAGARGAGGRWAGARQGRGSSAQGARGEQATGGRRSGRHGVGAQGRAAGHTVRVGHGRPGRGLGAGWVRRLGQLGQFWCTVHLAQF